MDLKEVSSGIDINHWYYQTKFLALKKLLVDIGIWPPIKIQESIIVDIEAFLNSLKVYPKHAYAVDISYPQDFLGMHKGIHFVRTLPEGIMPSYLFLWIFWSMLKAISNSLKSG